MKCKNNSFNNQMKQITFYLIQTQYFFFCKVQLILCQRKQDVKAIEKDIEEWGI